MIVLSRIVFLLELLLASLFLTVAGVLTRVRLLWLLGSSLSLSLLPPLILMLIEASRLRPVFVKVRAGPRLLRLPSVLCVVGWLLVLVHCSHAVVRAALFLVHQQLVSRIDLLKTLLVGLFRLFVKLG